MTTAPITRGRDLAVARFTGARIHQLLWEQKITNTAVAQAVGVTPSTFGKKLRGEVPITLDELMEIARLLDVEPGDLLPSKGDVLPRLDSNQQPSDYTSPQVSDPSGWVLAA